MITEFFLGSGVGRGLVPITEADKIAVIIEKNLRPQRMQSKNFRFFPSYGSQHTRKPIVPP